MIFRKPFALIGTYLALQPIRFTPSDCHQLKAWALTPRFHPYPPAGGRLFSVALAVGSGADRNLLPVRKYGALCCPDFPPPPWAEAAERAAGDCKGTTIMHKVILVKTLHVTPLQLTLALLIRTGANQNIG